MAKSLYFMLLLLAPACLHAQITGQYRDIIKKADSLNSNKQYKVAAETYLAALRSGSKMVFVSDMYNASCAMAHAGMADSAFYWLNLIAGSGGLADYRHVAGDTDLIYLHGDARWTALCNKVKENNDKKDREEANLDKPLVAILDTIYNDDQTGRRQIETTIKEFGQDSKQMKALGKTIHTADSVNLLKVQRILDKYGWLGTDKIGSQGNRTLFLVIQHTDIKTQGKYLPMMRAAVKNSKASASHLALLEDRVALRKGGKQIYGSQIATPKDGEAYIEPLDDPDNVDKRRAAVGLGPLADYVQRWNLKWDPETYKKQLPEIERKEKETFGKE